MPDYPMDAASNLALSLPEEVLAESYDLNAGYSPFQNRYDIIVQYTGDLEAALSPYPDVRFTLLYNDFAILNLPRTLLDAVLRLPPINYAELPTRLYFEVSQAKTASCIPIVYEAPYALSGRGILIAVIDSGIDIFHRAFRNPDGSSRILAYWDQTVNGTPPAGYFIGNAYTKEDLDAFLANPRSGQAVLPRDGSGHGTAVAGIAAGNDPAGSYQGVAYEASLLAVRLGNPLPGTFPRTSELMQAVNYCIEQSVRLQMPLVINLSFGNPYGDHTGTTLLESYLDQVSGIGRTVIVAGTGNEGGASTHAGGILTEPTRIQLSIGSFQTAFSIQLWKAYSDDFTVTLIAPNGISSGIVNRSFGPRTVQMGDTTLYALNSAPTPYRLRQEVLLALVPASTGGYITEGIWEILLSPNRLCLDRYDLWLPTASTLSAQTRFLLPDPAITLTIPSTAARVLSIGSYNSRTGQLSRFSGRGFTANGQVKPDLLAPGEDILAPAASSTAFPASPGSAYAAFTGTSFATPIASGSAALLMEWGILKGNDPFLYGQKVKAYLRKGARPLFNTALVPDGAQGYGSLCLRDSFPVT